MEKAHPTGFSQACSADRQVSVVGVGGVLRCGCGRGEQGGGSGGGHGQALLAARAGRQQGGSREAGMTVRGTERGQGSGHTLDDQAT